MKRHCKLIISTITMALIFTLVLSPCSFAISKQQFAAWVGSALQAISIVYNSATAPYYDFVDDYLYDPFRIVSSEADPYERIPYTWEDADDFMDRSVLKIDKDVVTIDGVDYTDVWLSTDAAEKFRTNAFDLATAFDIASQSNGTFVSGIGTFDGMSVYGQDASHWRTQTYSVGEGTNGCGNVQVRLTRQGASTPPFYDCVATYSNNDSNSWGSLQNGNSIWWRRNGTTFNAVYSNGTTSQSKRVASVTQNLFVNHPFDFDWVSGTIPADVPLTDEGLRIRVPTSEINQWYQDYPETGPNVTINMGDPELTQKVDDLIDLIIPLIPVLDIDFVEYDTPEPEPIPEPIPEPEPYPDPDPQPGTVIPDLDWTDLFQTIKNIFNQIAEQVSITTAIKNLLDKIKWFLDDFFGDLGDILNNLPDIFERHVIDTIRRGLSGLKNIFLPILALLRNALGIWHYVVEWFQAISTPFTFYLSIIGQGYPLITIPIYASIAGVIVIAVYRRFGR